MKKNRRSLGLHRETLRRLDAGFQRAARGGEIPDGSRGQPCRSPQTLLVTCSGQAGCNQTTTESPDSICLCTKG